MINTTDLSECEVLLPGDWLRKDNGDRYSFTVDKMELIDQRMFRQLIIRHPAGAPVSPEVQDLQISEDPLHPADVTQLVDPYHLDNPPQPDGPDYPAVQKLRYALIIKDEYCGVRIEDEDFIIREIVKKDSSAHMEWEDENGRPIVFDSLPPEV